MMAQVRLAWLRPGDGGHRGSARYRHAVPGPHWCPVAGYGIVSSVS